MRCQKLEILSHSEIYKEHKKYFDSISDDLNEYYRHYTNAKIILTLLEYWLYSFRCITEVYGVDAAISFSKYRHGSHLRFAYYYEYGFDINLPPERKIRNDSLFWLVAKQLKKAYLPGGNVHSIFNKISWRLTKFIVDSTPLIILENRKIDIIKKLTDSIDYMDSEVIKKCFDTVLPPVFYAEQIEISTKKQLHVDCSATAFIDFFGYENLMLLSRKLYVIGFQHGGGYDSLHPDYLQFFEKQLCDRYVGWGLSNYNIKQHRYSRGKPPTKYQGEGKRIIWVERGLLPLTFSLMSPGCYKQYQNRQVISYIHKELSSSGLGYYNLSYPGHNKSFYYDGVRDIELVNDNGKGEKSLCNNDVVIFDVFGATLIYFCIEFGVTYILTASQEDVPYFTESQAEWFYILKEFGLAFFDDEYGLLEKKLNEITSNKYIYPKIIEDYHEKTFINI